MDVLGTIWELLRGCLGLFLWPDLGWFMADLGGCLWLVSWLF